MKGRFKTSLVSVDKEDVGYIELINVSGQIPLTFTYDLTPSTELNLYKLKNYDLYQALCRIDELMLTYDHTEISFLTFTNIIERFTKNKFAF